MKLTNFSMTFRISPEGNTGYQNRSCLIIGEHHFPCYDWSLEDTDRIADDTIFSLSIPSGKLDGMVKRFYTGDDNDIYVTIHSCIWQGSIAGLLGGMSGYGSFDFISVSDALVSESRLLPDCVDSVSWQHFRMLRENFLIAIQLGVYFECLDYRCLTLDEYIFLTNLAALTPVLNHRDKILNNLKKEDSCLRIVPEDDILDYDEF